jgi:hypothetical protein
MGLAADARTSSVYLAAKRLPLSFLGSPRQDHLVSMIAMTCHTQSVK